MEANDTDKGKLFIGGLSWETSEDGLRNYFSKYGEVKDVSVKVDQNTMRPRGFGFVTYADETCVHKVLLATEPHILDGKRVDPKMATPKNQLPPPTSVQQTKVTSKVFVGGLPQILDSDKTQYEDKVDELQKELQKQMEEFVPGEPNLVVTEVEIKKDPSTGKHRGFGFVTFQTLEMAERACAVHYLTLRGRRIEIKPAESNSNSSFHKGRSWNHQPYQQPPYTQWDTRTSHHQQQQQQQSYDYFSSVPQSYGYSHYHQPQSGGYSHQPNAATSHMTGYESYSQNYGASRDAPAGYSQAYPQSYGYGGGATAQTGHTGYPQTQYGAQQQTTGYYGHGMHHST